MKSSVQPRIALLLALAGLPILAQAGTQAEYQALNTWCIGQIAGKSSAEKANQTTMAAAPRDSAGFAQYCEAYRVVMGMYGMSGAGHKSILLATVQNHLHYLIDSVPVDHYLLPEVYALRGRALYLNNQHAEAETALRKALQLDPRHAPVYATLADVYLDSKRKPMAQEAVRKGLALDPDSKSLKRLARALGIKVPAKPANAAPNIPEAPAKAPALEAGADKPAEKVEKAPPATTPTTPMAIGSTTNPWCRFCTDTPAAPAAPSPSTPGVIPKAGQ